MSPRPAPARRMGPADSASSSALLDAVDRVLREEGYGAISSRRVAEAAGLKQQLVYYYFRTMDDLLLACFQRRTARALAQLEADAASDRPVRAIWQTLSQASDGKLGFEFMALANHNPGLRGEIVRFMAESRRIATAAIERSVARGASLGPVTPSAAAFLLANCALMLTREAATGIEEGHADMRALVEWVLQRLD
jgi:AcrR family transcriptional regulator